MERSKAGTKRKEVSMAYHYLIKITIKNKHNMVVFHNIWKGTMKLSRTKNGLERF